MRDHRDVKGVEKVYFPKKDLRYIGRTIGTLKERIYCHKRIKSVNNPILTYNLLTEEYVVNIHCTCKNKEHARQAEAELIQTYYSEPKFRAGLINMFLYGQKLEGSYGWLNQWTREDYQREGYKRAKDWTNSSVRRNYSPNKDKLHWCRICKSYKIGHEFSYSSIRTSGLCSACTKCKSKEGAERVKRIRKLNEARPDSYWQHDDRLLLCRKCKEYKTIGNFYRDKTRLSGFEPYCKCCKNKKDQILKVKQKLKKQLKEMSDAS